MRTLNTRQRYVLFFFLSLVFAALAGCAGAIRSDAVKQLVEKEKTITERVDDGLQKQTTKIEASVQDLKDSHLRRLSGLQSREKELNEFQLFAANPRDMQNILLRQAALVSVAHLAELEKDRQARYANLQHDFETQADALLEAYKKILAATAKMKAQIDVLDSYVHTANFRFAAESIDLASIQAALSEFEEGKAFLEKATKAGEAIEKALGPARAFDQDARIHELLETLSLISSRLQELKQR